MKPIRLRHAAAVARIAQVRVPALVEAVKGALDQSKGLKKKEG